MFFLRSGRFRAFACRRSGRRSPCPFPEPVLCLFAESLRTATLPACDGRGRCADAASRCGEARPVCPDRFRVQEVRILLRGPVLPEPKRPDRESPRRPVRGAAAGRRGVRHTRPRGGGALSLRSRSGTFCGSPEKTARSAVCSRPCMSGGGPTRRGCFLDGHPPAAGFRTLRLLRPGERKGRDKNF